MAETSSRGRKVLVLSDYTECDEKLTAEISNYPFEYLVLGLDCEWVSSKHKVGKNTVSSPVALLQLAFPYGKCFLVRLCRMQGRLPAKLREILEQRSVIKVGVGISEDGKKLSQCYGVVLQGCVDLRHVAIRCRAYVHHCCGQDGTRHNMSLSSLSQQILGITLDKDWRVRCSNWEAETLSPRQIEYAANDAIISERIFFMLLLSKLKEKSNRFEAGNSDPAEGPGNEQDISSSPELEKSYEQDSRCATDVENVVKSNSMSDSGKTCSTTKYNDSLSTDQVQMDAPVLKLKETIDSFETLFGEPEGLVKQPEISSSPEECSSSSLDIENVMGSNFISKTCSTKNDSFISTSDEVQLLDVPASENVSLESKDNSGESSSANVGVFAGLLSKLSNFSLGLLTGCDQAKPVLQKSKGKSYSQYESFKDLALTEELFACREIWECLVPLCQGIVDLPYKMKTKNKNKVAKSGDDKPKQCGGTQKVKTGKVTGLKPRKAPLYQNCVLEAPDGQMLSTCDRRKVEWYLVRELADVVKEDDPYTVRLRFEPSGRPLDPEHNYYLTFKENVCVVCGRSDSYMRKNVIPHDYRKNFPVCMKDHHSHDVLLLCPPCHMISCNHDDMLRRQLAEKYNAPLASSQIARIIQDPVLKKVKSAAKALAYAGDKIPAKRREELLSTVREYLGNENPTGDMIAQVSQIEIRRENCDFVSHGREVVQQVREAGELLSFERLWREHFLSSMKPEYLPPLWTVDHEQKKVKRLLELELDTEQH